MSSNVQTLILAGERYVLLPEAEYRAMRGEPGGLRLPEKDSHGNYPALDALRVSLAAKIVGRRRALGLSQTELARRAGIRPETLNRLEQGRRSPTVSTVDKLDRVLREAEKVDVKRRRPGRRSAGR